MKNIDSHSHVSGKSVYIDDIPELQGTLHAVAIFSSVAHAKILKMDFSKAEHAQGVVAILTARDIKGENQIGGIIADEPLFAETEVHYIGQPIAVIIAQTHFAAKSARNKVEIFYEQKEVIIDPRLAKEKALCGWLCASPY